MKIKWQVRVLALLGVLFLSGCTQQSRTSSQQNNTSQTQTVAASVATSQQSQSTQATAHHEKQATTPWNSKKDAALAAFINQWAQTMGQSYTKYDGVHPLETLSGTYPADLAQEPVNGATNVLGWAPSGSGQYTYNVVAIYNYVGTEPPLPNHIAYFFAFHNGQPVVLVDQSRDGGPTATTTQNTDLRTNFAKIAAQH